MFTGIVAAVGRIERVEALENAAGGPGDHVGLALTIDSADLDLTDVAIGDSIAIQGACMTVIALDGARFRVEVSRESLSRTVGLAGPGEVNLEKALRLADRLGGHLVSGHVDGLGTVRLFDRVGESMRLVVAAPVALGRYLSAKGSITINGVSLTVNGVEDRPGACEFEVNLIPHTVAVTTLKALKPGVSVNLEIDMIARYVERMMSAPGPGEGAGAGYGAPAAGRD